jgi:hypothetical protein
MSKITMTGQAPPPTPASGKVAFYPKTDGLMYWKDDAGVEHAFGTSSGDEKTIVIDSPTDADDFTYGFTDIPITIVKILPILLGSSTPSWTWTIRHDPDRSAVGNEVITGGTVTTDVTTGTPITSFNDATIPANSHYWIEGTAQSGTVDQAAVTIFYNED